MKVYTVETEHNGVEVIFDSLEKAENYIAEYHDGLVKCGEYSTCYVYGVNANDEWPIAWVGWFEVE